MSVCYELRAACIADEFCLFGLCLRLCLRLLILSLRCLSCLSLLIFLGRISRFGRLGFKFAYCDGV